MLLVDANIFLAYENKEDVHHKQACALLNRIQEGVYGHWFITDYLFNEIVGVTFRKFGKERAAAIGDALLICTTIFYIDEQALQKAWRFFRETTTQLNLVDCTNLVALRMNDTDIIATFDEEFKKAAKVIS